MEKAEQQWGTINKRGLPAYCRSLHRSDMVAGRGEGEFGGGDFCSAVLTASCQFQWRMVPFPFLWMRTFAFLGTACSVSALNGAFSCTGLHPSGGKTSSSGWGAGLSRQL